MTTWGIGPRGVIGFVLFPGESLDLFYSPGSDTLGSQIFKLKLKVINKTEYIVTCWAGAEWV